MIPARILIVEDDVITSMDIEEILTSFGYSVAGTAASGEEAVRAAIELRPDLILMDIVLSGEMTGIEAAEIIRERAGIPVIYLTANADMPTVDSARKTEPFGYVLKPVSERELYSNIDAALQKHELMKRIKESEERYRMLVENAIEGILVVNEEKIVYANPQMSVITGYATGELVMRDYLDFVYQEDRAFIAGKYRKRLSGEAVENNYTFRMVHKSGEIRWIEIRAVPVMWQGEQAVLDFINDVTERKEANDRLQFYAHDLGKRVKELRYLYSVSKLLGETEHSLDEVFMLVLRHIADSMQYPEITCASLTFRGKTFVTPNFSETQWRLGCNIIVGGVKAGRIDVYYLEKRPEAGFGPFLFEEMDLLIELSIQLSKHIEFRQVEDERKLLSLIVESSEDAIIGMSLDSIIRSWNRGAERMFGYDAAEAVGRSINIIVPEARQKEVSEYMEKICRGGQIDHYETVRLHKSGAPINVSLTISPVVERDGMIIGASAISKDITAQKKMEKSVTEINIREREQLGHLLHDSLGQVLTGVAFMSEALRKGLAKKYPEASAQAAEIQSLVNSAIDLTRQISRGLVPVDLSENSLPDALCQLAELSSRLYSISCSADVDRAIGIGDQIMATQLYYIAQEAVRNAVTHGRSKNVVIALRRNNERLALTVRDDGKGMPDDLSSATGIGLKIMEYRSRFIGGNLSVIPVKPRGVLVACIVTLV